MHTTEIVLKTGQKISGILWQKDLFNGFVVLPEASPEEFSGEKLFFEDMISCKTLRTRILIDKLGDFDLLSEWEEEKNRFPKRDKDTLESEFLAEIFVQSFSDCLQEQKSLLAHAFFPIVDEEIVKKIFQIFNIPKENFNRIVYRLKSFGQMWPNTQGGWYLTNSVKVFFEQMANERFSDEELLGIKQLAQEEQNGS